MEGKTKPTSLQTNLLRTVQPSKFYWFKHQTIIYFLHFENNPEFHKNAFILLLVVPKAKPETWSKSRDEKLLTDALNDFRNTSAFLSLLENKQDRNYYSALITINCKKIEVRVVLENHRMFIELDSEVNEHAEYSPILNSVKVGTKFWECFYKEDDKLQGLFIEIYYIVYPKQFGDLHAGALFRIGKVVEFSFFVLQPEFVDGKVFIKKIEEFYNEVPTMKILKEENSFLHLLEVRYKSLFSNIWFELEGDCHRFGLVIGMTTLEQKAVKPVIQQLSQVLHKQYLLEEHQQKKVVTEVPTYSFGKELSISKLVVSFKLVTEVPEEPVGVEVVFFEFHFQKEENCYECVELRCCICFRHTVEGANLVFSVSKVKELFGKRREFVPKETGEITGVTKEQHTAAFLNGLVGYDPNAAVMLKGQERKQEENRKIKTKENRKVYFFIGLVVVVICFSSFLIYFCFRRKTAKAKRFVKKVQEQNVVSVV